jgi:ATPase subunit of ABC transporter with duplicated ATPase domains
MNSMLEISGATIATAGRRTLFDGLKLRLARDRVALMGRNGVGKSTLLAVLAGSVDLERGDLRARGHRHFVPQIIDEVAVRSGFGRTEPSAQQGIADEWLATSARSISGILRAPSLSRGELRKLALLTAKWSKADILLLDEPTEDLDDKGVAWLRRWLRTFDGCLVAASHDARLLADFEHFFIASESGCRVFSGTLAELDTELVHEHDETEQRYASNLHRLVASEKHSLHVARRKARKKRYGRCRELDRCTARVQLNKKRDQAQVSHGRLAAIREERLVALRERSVTARRALGVRLSLELPVPQLPENESARPLMLRGVTAAVDDRSLFPPLDLLVGRQRIGVVGPNGAGKTTLLQIMLGRRKPTSGVVIGTSSRLGAIEQGGTDWMLDESLLFHLERLLPDRSKDVLIELLVAHKFPLALGERPLSSLSPGERVRAALICLFAPTPPVELLVLDEPTYSVDRVGYHALTRALRAWSGGIVVASHDRAFLEAIGIETYIELGS